MEEWWGVGLADILVGNTEDEDSGDGRDGWGEGSFNSSPHQTA